MKKRARNSQPPDTGMGDGPLPEWQKECYPLYVEAMRRNMHDLLRHIPPARRRAFKKDVQPLSEEDFRAHTAHFTLEKRREFVALLQTMAYGPTAEEQAREEAKWDARFKEWGI